METRKAPVRKTVRYTLRDPSLAHQIVLLTVGVSCNCRYVRGIGYVTFAPLSDAETCFAAYLNPDNHRGDFEDVA